MKLPATRFAGRLRRPTGALDLMTDLGETKDLAAELPDRVVDLRGKLSAWRASIGAAMPVTRKPGAAPGAEVANPPGQGATAP